MKVNEDTVISLKESPLVLVPYVEKHVRHYHKWMQSAELLEQTASEPLTLAEEFSNMKSWRSDSEKLTFILLDTSIAANYMIGDVNLFVLRNSELGAHVAELEIMIAESRARRRGHAQNALRVLMAYCAQHLQIDTFIAKTLKDNAASIALFKHKLGFDQYCEVKVFNEVHLRRDVDDDLRSVLDQVRSSWSVQEFRKSTYFTNPIDNAPL